MQNALYFCFYKRSMFEINTGVEQELCEGACKSENIISKGNANN